MRHQVSQLVDVIDLRGRAADGLDAVSIGIENEGRE
jgi:hypothetical protein